MNSKSYVRLFTIMLVSFFILLFLTGCDVKYNFSNVDQSPFLKDALYKPMPDAKEVVVSLHSLAEIDDFTVIDNTVFVSCDQPTNYVLSQNLNYTFVFLNSAIFTVDTLVNNLSMPLAISLAENLFVNLKGDIYANITTPFTFNKQASGIDPDILNQLTDNKYSAIICGNNIDIYCTKSKLSQNGLALDGKNLNFACKELSIDCTSAISGNSNFYSGKITINCTDTAITAKTINSYGGSLVINSSRNAINCDMFTIFNGVININCKNEAITTASFIKSGGYAVIKSKTGILAENVYVNSGYFYVKCEDFAIKSTSGLFFSGGTNICVATSPNKMGIEAENATFTVSGGLVIESSSFVCVPADNYLCFNVKSNKVFSLFNKNDAVNYVPEVDGSLMVASVNSYTFYSTSASIVNNGKNFYGLLINCKVNPNSNISINSSVKKNYGATIINSNKQPLQNQLF